jgi:hypothetical protein
MPRVLHHSPRTAAVWLACGLVFAGCTRPADDSRPAAVPVRGSVTFAGLPAPGVLVVLYPADGSPAAKAGVKPSATTDADGTFVLSTYGQNDGAVPGEYAVTIQWFQSAAKNARKGPGMVPGFAPRVDHFKGRYKDPATSPWHVEITEGENVLQPFAID